MLAVDGLMEFPFAPLGVAERIEGREALARHLQAPRKLIEFTSTGESCRARDPRPGGVHPRVRRVWPRGRHERALRTALHLGHPRPRRSDCPLQGLLEPASHSAHPEGVGSASVEIVTGPAAGCHWARGPASGTTCPEEPRRNDMDQVSDEGRIKKHARDAGHLRCTDRDGRQHDPSRRRVV